MKRRSFLLLAVLLNSCGGGGAATPTPSAPAALSIGYYALPIGPPVAPTAPALSASPAVITSEQFLMPQPDALLLAPSNHDASTTWSISGTAASLQTTEPGILTLPGDSPATAPAGDIFVNGTGPGVVTVTATSGTQSATLQIINYSSLSLGCAFRYTPAFAFDADRAASLTPSNWITADLFASEAANPTGNAFDNCAGTALAGTTDAIHVPYGGTLIATPSAQSFAAITAAQWKNDATTFPANTSGTIVFKTKEGRIVKALIPLGPFEVSDTTGVFPF